MRPLPKWYKKKKKGTPFSATVKKSTFILHMHEWMNEWMNEWVNEWLSSSWAPPLTCMAHIYPLRWATCGFSHSLLLIALHWCFDVWRSFHSIHKNKLLWPTVSHLTIKIKHHELLFFRWAADMTGPEEPFCTKTGACAGLQCDHTLTFSPKYSNSSCKNENNWPNKETIFIQLEWVIQLHWPAKHIWTVSEGIIKQCQINNEGMWR